MWRWEHEHGLWRTFRPVKGTVHHWIVPVSRLKGEYLRLDKTDDQIEIWGAGNKNTDYGELSARLKGQSIIG
jgi:hypothetical protein